MNCSRCKQNPPREGQRLCRTCHAANMREHRAGRAGELERLKEEVRGLTMVVAQLRSELAVARALGAGLDVAREAARGTAQRPRVARETAA